MEKSKISIKKCSHKECGYSYNEGCLMDGWDMSTCMKIHDNFPDPEKCIAKKIVLERKMEELLQGEIK
jgi:hypothetical protein